MPDRADAGKTIVIRDRRKPNQYTTDNVLAREWLPILRVGDAFFLYSVYLSMANRETESSWSSLRTLAEYLQCSVDLIIRGNKLLEICELIHIETGNYRTSNEYYILDPPALTPELKNRIELRLQDVLASETSRNWLAWVEQVRKALDRYRSLPEIWAERRARRGGRPIKTVRPQKGARETQPPAENPARESQPQRSWDTSTAHVSHTQGAREPQAKQEQETRTDQQEIMKDTDPPDVVVRARCRGLGITEQVIDLLLAHYTLPSLIQQLNWLPFRNARDPAAMLVSAVQGSWSAPPDYSAQASERIWLEWLGDGQHAAADSQATQSGPPEHDEPLLTARAAWATVLEELRMQMTRVTFDTWLSGTRVVAVRDGEMVIRVRDAYAAEWLRERWMSPIERTVAGVVGHATQVRFEV